MQQEHSTAKQQTSRQTAKEKEKKQSILSLASFRRPFPLRPAPNLAAPLLLGLPWSRLRLAPRPLLNSTTPPEAAIVGTGH